MSLTGMTDEERKDFRIMKALDRFTKLTAQERMRESEGLLDKLSREKDLMYTVNLEAEHFPGFRMYEPKILTGNNRSLQIKNGSINLRERVKDPAEISNAIFIYSVGRKLE